MSPPRATATRYESHSADGTRAALASWAGESWRVELLPALEGDDPSLPRAVRLGRIRDALLASALAERGVDFVLAADLDFRTEWSLRGVGAALLFPPAAWSVADGVCAYGTLKASDGVDHVYETRCFRDAHVTAEKEGTTGIGRSVMHVGRRVYRRLLYARDEPLWPLLPVRSCFGGLAIYNASRLASRGRCGYEAPRSTDCEHANLHSCLARQPRGFRLFLHPQMHLPAPPITQPGAAPLTGHEELPSDLPADLDPDAVRASAMRWFEFNARQLVSHDPPTALQLALELWRASARRAPSGGPPTPIFAAVQLTVSALEAMGERCDAASAQGHAAPKGCAKPDLRDPSALSDVSGSYLLYFSPQSVALRQAELRVMASVSDEEVE